MSELKRQKHRIKMNEAAQWIGEEQQTMGEREEASLEAEVIDLKNTVIQRDAEITKLEDRLLEKNEVARSLRKQIMELEETISSLRGITAYKREEPAVKTKGKFRVGRKVGRTIYLTCGCDNDHQGDQLVGVMDTPELAARVVEGLNLLDALPMEPKTDNPAYTKTTVTTKYNEYDQGWNIETDH